MWGLRYFLRMSDRVAGELKIEELKLQTLNLMPERYKQLYDQPNSVSIFGSDPELPVTDPDQLNEYYANLDRPRMMNGAGNTQLLGSANGSGRRV
jgi:hypothetical protein